MRARARAHLVIFLAVAGIYVTAVLRVVCVSSTGESEDGSVQPAHSVAFSSDMDVLSVSLFLGDNGIPTDVCELFEGESCG